MSHYQYIGQWKRSNKRDPNGFGYRPPQHHLFDIGVIPSGQQLFARLLRVFASAET